MNNEEILNIIVNPEPLINSRFRKINLIYKDNVYSSVNKYTINKDIELFYLDSFKIFKNMIIDGKEIIVNETLPESPLFKIENNKVILQNPENYRTRVSIDGILQKYKSEGIYELLDNTTSHLINCEYVNENLLTEKTEQFAINISNIDIVADDPENVENNCEPVKFEYFSITDDDKWFNDPDEGLYSSDLNSCIDEWGENYHFEDLPENFPKDDEFELYTIRNIKYGKLLESEIILEYIYNKDKVEDIIIKNKAKKPRILAIIHRKTNKIEYRRTKDFVNSPDSFILDIEFEKVHPTPVIINKNEGSDCFIGIPHVIRYVDHYYYATINGEKYNLGTLIDEYKIPLNKRVDLKISCEYKQYGKIKIGDTISTSFIVDTEFPSYPKLNKDLESIMIEPFKIDVVRENGINYIAELNGDNYNELDSTNASEKYITENREFINGEFLLGTQANKESNDTFRFRSSYFTINTFQHVPLKPLKTKVLPLKFENYESKGNDGEFVVNSNTGHYGIVHDGEVYSPTLLMDTELLRLEEDSNDISKMYIKCKRELDTLKQRINNNKKNMYKMFSNKNKDYINLILLQEEIKNIKKEIIDLSKENDTNKINLKDIDFKIENIKVKISNFKNILESDSAIANSIIHDYLLKTFSNLREAKYNCAILKKRINNILLTEKFEEYMAKEEERYNKFKDEIRKICLERGVSNE